MGRSYYDSGPICDRRGSVTAIRDWTSCGRADMTDGICGQDDDYIVDVHEGLLEMMTDLDAVLRKNGVNYSLMYGTAIGAVRHKGFIPWDDDLDIVILDDQRELFEESLKDLPEGKYFLQKPLTQDWPNAFYKFRLNNSTAIEEAHLRARYHQGLFIDVFLARRCPAPGLKRRLYLAIEVAQRGVRIASFVTIGRRWLNWLQWILFWMYRGGTRIMRFLASKNEDYLYFDEPTGCREIFPRKLVEDTMDIEFEGRTFRLVRDYDTILTYSFGDYMTPPPEEERKVKQHLIAYDRNRDYRDWFAENGPRNGKK